MIGVLGGTFDPIHFGHLRPALDLLQDLELREVRFLPLGIPVHRPLPLASPAQRLAMVKAAIAGLDGFRADERELRRPGQTYTYDTLLSLRQELGERRSICLLVGADAFRGFLSWRRPEGILEQAHIVVMQRPGKQASLAGPLRDWCESRTCADPADLAGTPAGRILFRVVTQLGISATAIRRLVARGQSPRYLLPDAVLRIIEREGLYQGRTKGVAPIGGSARPG